MTLRNWRSFGSLAGFSVLLGTLYLFSDTLTRNTGFGTSPNLGLKDIYLGVAENNLLESRFIQGVPGFHLFENLYLYNGTFFFISNLSEESPDYPPANGHILCGIPTDEGKRIDGGEDRFARITPAHAIARLGNKFAIRVDGSSIWLNDEDRPKAGTYMGHYFHFVCEAFLGAWRLLSSDHAQRSSVYSPSVTPAPRRIMFRTPPSDWRDPAGLSAWFLTNILPDTSVEDQFVWADRKDSQSAFLFDRIVIVDRFAAHRYGPRNGLWNKMTAELSRIEAPRDWISPLRNRILSLGRLSGCDLDRRDPNVPVVTYIDRQKTSRRLVDEDAACLLRKMEELDSRGVIEFHAAQMENIPRALQFCLASKTDILIGVHGNGLSHQLWMKPGGSVIEIMDIGGFALDYAVPAKLMGHRYHAIHNDTMFRSNQWVTPQGRPTYQSKGFHGNKIRVDGNFLQGLVESLASS